MWGIDVMPLALFAVITSITPGPNNLMCASIGVQHGLGKTWRFLCGMTAGVAVVMLACGMAANLSHGALAGVEPVLRYVGAAYIIWLAWKVFRTDMAETDGAVTPVGFWKGLCLQLVNTKVIVYGLTLYTTFMAPVAGRPAGVLLSAMAFAVVGFAAAAVWAVFGQAIRSCLHDRRLLRAINAVLSLMLVYCAASLSGILG